MQKLLVDVKAKHTTMAKKFKNCGQMESIVMHFQNAPIYYVKYKYEENEFKALIELVNEKGMAEVIAVE